MISLRKAIFLLIVCLTSSCSNDDNGPTAPVANTTEPKVQPGPNLQHGIFTDSPVQGIDFKTESQSGSTSENGKFRYFEGETITFSLGELILGSTTASEELSPLDITGISNADLNTLEVKNIAALLQTLDVDKDPSNGITITPEVKGLVSAMEIDFSKPIETSLSEIVLQVISETQTDLQLVNREEAVKHLANTLEMDYESTDPLYTHFFPFIESFTAYNLETHYKAVVWKNEFNDAGQLIKVTCYERYPMREMALITFSEHDSSGLPLKMDYTFIKDFYYSRAINPEPRPVILSYQDGFVSNMAFEYHTLTKLTYNGQNKLDSFKSVNDYGEWSVKLSYDNGNFNRRDNFDDNGESTSSILYTFDEVGNWSTRKYYDHYPDTLVTDRWYEYRDDHSLEKSFVNFHSEITQEVVNTGFTEYDQHELKAYSENTWENAEGETVINKINYSEGEPKLSETYVDGFLQEKLIYESTFVYQKTFFFKDGYYDIYFYDENYWTEEVAIWNHYKVEAFDSKGRLFLLGIIDPQHENLTDTWYSEDGSYAIYYYIWNATNWTWELVKEEYYNTDGELIETTYNSGKRQPRQNPKAPPKQMLPAIFDQPLRMTNK